MRTKVAKWGNSLAIRIPAALAEEVSLREGDTVDVTPDGRQLRVSPEDAELTMDEVLARITDDNIHERVEFGAPVGRELI